MKIQLLGKYGSEFANVHAIADGIKEAGHSLFPVNPEAPESIAGLSDDVDFTIIMKRPKKAVGELDDLSHPILLWMPDELRAFGRTKWLKDCDWVDYHLVFDDSAIELYVEEGIPEEYVMFLPLSGNPSVYKPLDAEHVSYDFVHVGTPNAHRNELVRRLRGFGYSVLDTVEMDGYKANWLYHYGRVVLNHGHPVGQPFGKGYGLQQRVWEVGMSGQILLMNELIDGDDLSLPNVVHFNQSTLEEKAEEALLKAVSNSKVETSMFYRRNHGYCHRVASLVQGMVERGWLSAS